MIPFILMGIFASILLFLPGFSGTDQSKNDLGLEIKSVLRKVNTQNLRDTIAHLQLYENRSTWENQWKVARWVSEEFKKIGLEVDMHNYEYHGKIWPNVIAKINGRTRPEEIIMPIAHIDSISDHPQKIAPGADDNATGVAALLEMARVLKGTPMERTIMFVIFTNEESCRAGSRAYSHLVKSKGVNIKAVINLDIHGYNRPVWPFYWGAVTGHHTLKHKVKAIYRMARNYFFGMIYGENVVKVAGREPNRKLVEATSKILRNVSGLKIKETVKKDSG